jgi:hypothetical protein
MSDDDIQEYVRPWRGLTDQEIGQAYKEKCDEVDHWLDKRAFLMAVGWAEKKLKERNNG